MSRDWSEIVFVLAVALAVAIVVLACAGAIKMIAIPVQQPAIKN